MKKTVLAYALMAQAAAAHSGHEAAIVAGEAHWLTEADHLVVVVFAIALAGLVVSRLVRRGRGRAARETR